MNRRTFLGRLMVFVGLGTAVPVLARKVDYVHFKPLVEMDIDYAADLRKGLPKGTVPTYSGPYTNPGFSYNVTAGYFPNTGKIRAEIDGKIVDFIVE